MTSEATSLKLCFIRHLLLCTAVLTVSACSQEQEVETPAAERSEPSPETVPFEKGPYEVRVERSHFVPMRDGVRLSTDLYFPVGVEGQLPVILERTPYDKGSKRNADPDAPISGANQAYYYASHGYLFTVQDRRGKFESEGDYVVLNGDVEDAADTLDWFAEQPWFSGKTSMIGCSIPGANQIKAAQTLHPALTSIIPQSAATGHGTAGGTMAKLWKRGGATNLTMALWAHFSGTNLFYRPSRRLSREEFLQVADFYEPAPNLGVDLFSLAGDPDLYNKYFVDTMLVLPSIDIAEVLESPPSDWEDLTREPMDPWWDGGDYLEDDTRVNAAALHINSWHDYGVNETFLQFRHFSDKAETQYARDNQFVIISPLAHCNIESVSSRTVSGQRDMGDARKDIWGTYLRWWDYTLKGLENGFDKEPKIQYYVPGRNAWKSSDVWPIEGTTPTRFFLTSGGDAGGSMDSGRIVSAAPDTAGSDTYVYDPANPIMEPIRAVHSGSFDLSDVQARPDVLVYTSEPLTEGIEITGKMRATIHVSTDVPDTDLSVKLYDVYPDGRAFALQEGYLRLRYREGYDRMVLMEPGVVYPIEIDMLVYANYFQPGHRIRVDITSSNLPTYDRNMNTGGDTVRESEGRKATITVHHGGEYPSHVELPIVPT